VASRGIRDHDELELPVGPEREHAASSAAQ
jgi:hypothetical protein